MPERSAIAAAIEEIARRPVRLGARNPETPHEQLSELRGALFGLAGRVRHGVPLAALPAPAGAAPPARAVIDPGERVVGRRRIPVVRTTRTRARARAEIAAELDRLFGIARP